MHARRTLHTLRRLTMTRRASIMSGEGTAAHAAEISAESGGWEQLKELAQFGALVAFCNTFVVTNMQCIGPSMLPTLGESGDNVLMIPTASGFKPQRGDVVVCASPTDPTSTVCKRVVGLEGDVVSYRRLPGMPLENHGVVVPRGQCFLQGDNEWDSTDSRYYGPVPLALVRGIVFAKVWPLSEAGWITRRRPLPPPPPPAIVAQRQREAEAARRRTESTPVRGADDVPSSGSDEATHGPERHSAEDPKVAIAWRSKLLREADWHGEHAHVALASAGRLVADHSKQLQQGAFHQASVQGHQDPPVA